MNKIILLLVIAAGIAWLALHDSNLDKLMKKQQPIPDKAGIKSIEFEYGDVDIESYAERGLITVIYFYDEKCPSVPTWDANMQSLVKVRPDVAVRKFSLGKTWSEKGAYNKYKLHIGKIPFFVIYMPDGKIIAADKGAKGKAQDLLYEWINAELNKH